MRINSVMRNRIQNVVNEKRRAAIDEARKDIIAKQEEFDKARQEILNEANKKLWELVNKYDARIPYWNEKPREDSNLVSHDSFKILDTKEVAKRVTEIDAKSLHMAEDIEIRLSLSKEADDFFKALEEISF